jgi:hypothetical protein
VRIHQVVLGMWYESLSRGGGINIASKTTANGWPQLLIPHSAIDSRKQFVHERLEERRVGICVFSRNTQATIQAKRSGRPRLDEKCVVRHLIKIVWRGEARARLNPSAR